MPPVEPDESPGPPTAADIRDGDYFLTGSRVTHADVVALDDEAERVRLSLVFADGATFGIEPPAGDSDDAGTDGELFTPAGHLSVGPGLAWAWVPRA